MLTTEQMEAEITAIKIRNQRVEQDKAWETSLTRKIAIVLLTYAVVVLFFYTAGLPKPFINALVPVFGFVLSTLSVSYLKKKWLNKIYNK